MNLCGTGWSTSRRLSRIGQSALHKEISDSVISRLSGDRARLLRESAGKTTRNFAPKKQARAGVVIGCSDKKTALADYSLAAGMRRGQSKRVSDGKPAKQLLERFRTASSRALKDGADLRFKAIA